MDQLIKRKIGAQPGNQNARKHGFYSRILSLEEQRELKNAVEVDGLDQEIAILRVKFKTLLAEDGQNLRLINRTASTLAKLYSIKYGLNKKDNDVLKNAVRAVIDEFVFPSPPDSETASSNPVPAVPVSNSHF